MDFDDLEQEEVSRGCADFTSVTEELPFRKLEDVRIGSTVRVLRNPEDVAAACSRVGIGPQNQQQARAAAGLLVKVLEKDVDQTVKCAVPSVGNTWFALSALQPAQVCSSCGGAVLGLTCDRCGRQCAPSAASPLTFEQPDLSMARGGDEGGQEGAAGTDDDADLWLDQAALEAEIEKRICRETEAEMAEAGGVVGALLEVECCMAAPLADDRKATKVYFADAVNKVWSSCAEVFMKPEPALASFGRRIVYIFKLLTVVVHLRFQAHARAHFQTFVDTLAKPRTGLRDAIGRWLSSSQPERAKKEPELQRMLEHKVRALVRCLELAIACRPIPVDASCDSVAQSLDRLCRLVLAGTTDTEGQLSPEEELATWGGWEVFPPEGEGPVPVVRRSGAHTVEVWSAGRRDANGVYAVTIFDSSKNVAGHPTFIGDGGSYIMHAHDCWWIARDDKAFYVTATPIPWPRSGTASDDWLLRPFPMIRGTPLVKVSLDASTRLLAELRLAYADPSFQQEYQEIRASSGNHVAYTVAVQARILTRYGFEGSVAGVLEMRRHTCFWCPSDAACRKLLRDIHSLLEYGKPFAAPTLCLDSLDQEPSPAEPQEEDREEQFVLVRPVNGLCNRLSAIVAAWLMAKDLGRRLVVDWQCTECCNCPWERLMQVPEEILALTEELLEQHHCLRVGLDLLEYFHAGSNTNYKPPERVRPLCHESARDLKRVACGSFCGPASYIDVDSEEWKALRRLRGVPFEQLPLALQLPCASVLAFDDFYPPASDFRAARAERSALLNCLRPVSGVLERVVELPPGTVGMHVRRTDHWEACTYSPEDLFIEKLDELLSMASDGTQAVSDGAQTIFLATDCPELEKRLRQRYGERIMSLQKRTLDRSMPAGIEDAFADLLSLAQCSELIGSFESTFSRTASLFNCIPLAVIYRDPSPLAK